MYLIGLTGGIASGKSTVASALTEHGAVVIDADRLAREVVEPGSPVLAAIAAEFGTALVGPDGALDRPRLGAIVFGDPAALARLNAIVHPAVRSLTNARIRAAGLANPSAVVVYDVPLLVEAAVEHPFDLVVVTQATPETRMQRMVDLRRMSQEDAAMRIRAQADDAERLAIADVVIDTDGTLEHTLRQVDALWERVRSAGNSAGTESVGGRI
ncbi:MULTISPECIES: dephospho-CoA kinase [unclassified Cryobacterium]|uniref:dephospho-CoA kinase n=1 Tax=unclassified Cryobacterium TaxID=2649013 RepID=UPI0010697A41|nr:MULTISPECIES: dephospho-CoA kinase [unclassified Cryobacterium]MEB0285945.1 dephospho-CoA kinase [Cryobacterium sp. 10S3]MEB0304022.1 dephospho-CoA kinase [Cryobacterium sp. 10I1]TFB93568.1 dephospho-CoA kinase [Cryobacterium sp. MDB2-A-1]TFC10096.1 dephospho-CoA kinase [Cryobacterium sp. MDB2-33-2]TFC11931.1 dephospho-CoA kinase [Cryobacterium sp. MDB2-A-2]